MQITISGGEITVKASDDGLNSAGGSDEMSAAPPRIASGIRQIQTAGFESQAERLSPELSHTNGYGNLQ